MPRGEPAKPVCMRLTRDIIERNVSEAARAHYMRLALDQYQNLREHGRAAHDAAMVTFGTTIVRLLWDGHELRPVA